MERIGIYLNDKLNIYHFYLFKFLNIKLNVKFKFDDKHEYIVNEHEFVNNEHEFVNHKH